MELFLISISFVLVSFMLVYIRVSDSVSKNHSKTYLRKHRKGWKNKLFFWDFREDVHKLNLILLYFNYAVIALCILTGIIAIFLEDKYSIFAAAFQLSLVLLVIEIIIGAVEAAITVWHKTSTMTVLVVAAVIIVAAAGFVMFVIDYFDVDFSEIFLGS